MVEGGWEKISEVDRGGGGKWVNGKTEKGKTGEKGGGEGGVFYLCGRRDFHDALSSPFKTKSPQRALLDPDVTTLHTRCNSIFI